MVFCFLVAMTWEVIGAVIRMFISKTRTIVNNLEERYKRKLVSQSHAPHVIKCNATRIISCRVCLKYCECFGKRHRWNTTTVKAGLFLGCEHSILWVWSPIDKYCFLNVSSKSLTFMNNATYIWLCPLQNHKRPDAVFHPLRFQEVCSSWFYEPSDLTKVTDHNMMDFLVHIRV